LKYISTDVSWKKGLENVQLFIDNLLWGNIKIDYSKFGINGQDDADELERKIKSHMEDDYCIDDERRVTEEPKLKWMLDFWIKAVSHGAMSGELRDQTYENKIKELEKEVEKWKDAHERVKADNIVLANELVDRQNLIDTYESVFKSRNDNSK
jgi:hypothetical protein